MRTLRIFLPVLVACGAALLLADPSREESKAELPAAAPLPGGEPLLAGADLAAPGTKAPFAARLHKLDDIRLRLVEDGYVRAYLRIGRLARGEDGVALEQATGGVFDPPEGDRPSLRLTLEAPRITGDATALLDDGEEAPRRVTLEGGVVVRDAAGRTLMQTERLHAELKARTFSTDGAVALDDPERGVVVRGTGLHADVGLRRVTLLRDVTATMTRDGARIELSSSGPATVEHDEEAGTLVLTLAEGVRMAHPLASVTCAAVEARMQRGEDGTYALAEAVLGGGVEIRPEPGAAGGLDTIGAPTVRLEGESRVHCAGPLTAVRRGPLAALGLGERVLEIAAEGGAVLLLRRRDADAVEVEEIRFPAGFEAKDRDGAGRFRARVVTYVRAENRVEALDVEEAVTPEGSVQAAALRAQGGADEAYRVRLEGEKRIRRFGEARIGGTPRGALDLTCSGPLTLDARGRDLDFEAEGSVVARVEDRSRLEGARIRIEVRDRKLARFAAEGDVLLRDEARESEVRGASLVFADGTARVEGTPAEARLPAGRFVAARSLSYSEDRSFAAEGDVRIEGPLSAKDEAGAWRIRCGRATGALAESGPPERVVAEGGIEALGPEGQRIEGARLEYANERARLEGAPAVVARGEDLRVSAKGFVLELEGRELAAARSTGPAQVDVKPAAARAGDFSRWHIELKGPARLSGDLLVVDAGARIEGFDPKDRPAVRADANRVEVALERGEGGWTARELRAGKGVVVEGLGDRPAKVTAERLAYVPGTRRVDVYGGAEVVAEGWPSKVRFEKVVFVVTKDGVDLRRASGVAVEGERRSGR